MSEPGDPTTDIHPAGKLNDRLQAKLAKGVYLTSLERMRVAGAAFDFRHVLDEFGAADGVQELLRDSLLQVEIPESLECGTFAGEARL